MYRAGSSFSSCLISTLIYGILATAFPLLCPAQEAVLNTLDLYYSSAPVTCKFTLLEEDNKSIYAILNFNQDVKDSIWVSYRLDNSQGILIDSSLVEPGQKYQVLKWSFIDEMPELITVYFNWNAREWIFQEHFPRDAIHESGGVSIWRSSLPWFDPWAHVEDRLLLKSTSSDSIYTYFYSHKFDPARPPMTINPGKGGAPLKIDSLFVLEAGEYFIPDKEGLYFFQSDSSTTQGVSLVVTQKKFPVPEQVPDLTEPLVYISTRNEFQQIKEDFASKQALDKFWLSTLKSPEKARVAIKDYYQNVEEANKLFTSYKEGWKTDRGMVYVVFGRPLIIQKDVDSELWSYQDIGGERVTFRFKKVRNIFSNNHYELFREKSYDRPWFVAIDRWREGRIP